MATLYGLGNLECGIGNLKVWPAFLPSHASKFADVFMSLGINKRSNKKFEDGTTCA